jgi:hypothetical protein
MSQAARRGSWTAGSYSTVGPNYRSNKVSLKCLKLLGMTAGTCSNERPNYRSNMVFLESLKLLGMTAGACSM